MRFWSACVCSLALLPRPCSGQTLAHKNWAGSGISIEPWYQSAIFYQVAPLLFQVSVGKIAGGLSGVTERLPYLEQLGVDALVLSPLPLNPPGQEPLDATYGTLDDFDRLEREANLRHVRILVEVPLALPHAQLLSTVRFWLGRGVAGLRLTGSSPENTATLREVRAIAGPNHLLLTETASEAGPASQRAEPRPRSELRFDKRLLAAQTLDPELLRAALAGANLLSDAAGVERSFSRLGDGRHDLPLARITAAALLLGRGAPLLDCGQELGLPGLLPDVPTERIAAEDKEANSLLRWYRRLGELHHAQDAVRNGSLAVLPTVSPGVLAWVRRPRSGSAPAVLVLVNFAERTSVIPLGAVVPMRGVRATLLLKSDAEPGSDAAEPVSALADVALEPYGVAVVQLRSGTGLESIVVPARRRH